MSIKTRLQLRHDSLSAWEKSTDKLFAGEIAFAENTDGTFTMKVGDGDKTWSQLSASPIVWTADQIIGLTDAISELSTTHYEKATLEELDALSASCKNGDTGVVKTKIGTREENGETIDIYSYTAYVFDGSLSSWKAMDGNYNADNVYFDADIVTAGSWEKIGNLSHTKNTVGSIDAAGKSLSEFMDSIFKGEEGFPTKPTPSCTITQVAQTVEIGTKVKPKFTLSFDKKSYAYGTNTNNTLNSTTGVIPKTYEITYTDLSGDRTLTGDWTTSITSDYEIQVKAGNGNITTVEDLTVSYDAAADGTYIPRSNLERVLSSDAELVKYRVAGGTCSDTNNITKQIIGYYPNFYGFRPDGDMFDAEALTMDDLGKLTKQTSNVTASSGYITPSSSINTNSTWRQMFYVVPSGQGKSIPAAVNSNGLPLTMKKAAKTITVTHVNGVTSTYDVFYSQQGAVAAATTVTLTW